MTGARSTPPAPVQHATRPTGRPVLPPARPTGNHGSLPEPLGAYLRLTRTLVRGPLGVGLAIVFLGGTSALGGRGGLALASAWLLMSGTYCLLNFWHCRETHCVVTGLGWAPLGLLGLAVAAAPTTPLSWHEWWELVVAAYLVILAAGFSLQCVVASRTGRRYL